MSRLPDDLLRDRALRDSAWEVVAQDVAWLREDVERRGIGGRVLDRASRRAARAAGAAGKAAMGNRGVIAAGAAALGLLLARRPIMNLLRKLRGRNEMDGQAEVHAADGMESAHHDADDHQEHVK